MSTYVSPIHFNPPTLPHPTLTRTLILTYPLITNLPLSLSIGLLESSSRRSNSRERRVSITDGNGRTDGGIGGIGLRRPSFTIPSASPSLSRPNSPYEINFTNNNSHNHNNHNNHNTNHNNHESILVNDPPSSSSSSLLSHIPKWIKDHYVPVIIAVVTLLVLTIIFYDPSTRRQEGRGNHGRYHHRLVCWNMPQGEFFSRSR